MFICDSLFYLWGDVIMKILIDKNDEHLLKSYKWYFDKRKYTSYLVTSISGKTVRIHRLIMNAKAGEVVDHINSNGLDNRRKNLRICSQSLNMHNTRKARSKHGFRGIYKKTNTWSASLNYNKKTYKSHGFKTAAEAAAARDLLAIKYYGAAAKLNFTISTAEVLK